uniref:Uncharacterized protein n=1 Tax=Tetranychus urticae TaxID=32264 RepID=T1L0M7_TETUR
MILFLKSTLAVSIRAICIAIFAWQFYLLTQNYQEFNVRKEVTHYIPDEIEFPEIRIKIPYQFALDPVILQTKYKSQFDEVCSDLSTKKECNGHLTYPLIFSKSFGPYLRLSDIDDHSYAPEMFMARIFTAGPKVDPLKTGECKLISEASSSCLVLILRCLDSSSLPLKLSRVDAVVNNANHLFGFPLKAKAMLLNLVYPGKAAVEDDSLYVYSSLTPGKQVTHGIHFTKHTENLLPSPHKTMCKDYNRRQTFEDCLNSNSSDQTGLLFPGTTVSLEKYKQTNEIRFNAMFRKDNGTLCEIYKRCRSLVTQPMCSSVQYSFKMSKTIEDVAKGEEKLIFHFSVSSEPDSLTESKPEFPLSDYIILSGSLISTWFGISIIGQLLVASDLFCLAVERKKTAVSENQNEAVEPEVINQ